MENGDRKTPPTPGTYRVRQSELSVDQTAGRPRLMTPQPKVIRANQLEEVTSALRRMEKKVDDMEDLLEHLEEMVREIWIHRAIGRRNQP